MPNAPFQPRQTTRQAALSILLLAIVLTPTGNPHAQRSKNGPVNVAGVATKHADGRTVVTISADTPLNHTQTWQDAEGFHLVLPKAGRSNLKGVPRGVKVRQLDEALELLVPVRPGSSVTVEPHFNHLNLVVNGGIDTTQSETETSAPAASRRRESRERKDDSLAETSTGRLPRAMRNAGVETPLVASAASDQIETRSASVPVAASSSSSSASAPAASQQSASSVGAQQAVPQPSAQPQASAQPTDNAQAATSQPLVPVTDGAAPPPQQPSSEQAAPPVEVAESGPGFIARLFSITGVVIFLVLGVAALFLVRFIRARQEEKFESKTDKKEAQQGAETVEAVEAQAVNGAVEETGVERRREERRKEVRRSSDQPAAQKASHASSGEQETRQQALEVRQQPAGPAAIYGAYRVDQEVGKLLLGQPHRMDVLLSRAADDRRAMETSLMKALQSPEVEEEGRRRARRALEEYGFVARQAATLLLAHDAYERASAARVLGEIGAASALPFLLEALYDSELVVRTHAVMSLGELKLPAAIGALLDMARKCPEVPSELLSRALNACSVDSLVTFASLNLEDEQALLANLAEEDFTGEITHLDPSGKVEQLPEWLENESLSEALSRLESTDVEARTAAVRQLAQFQVKRSVEALSMIAARDEESSVRAAAISSLGAIDHESVFAPVLIALADEAREVRAAAARALSRLSFDRADAYVRVLETADAETLRGVARACIEAGIVAQVIDRLSSEDRRQAYEAFSMLSLLAKSNEIGPLLEAIANHADINVRLAATRLLGLSGGPEVSEQLRPLIVRDGLPEKVRTALLEVVYKMDQAQPA
ncbi:MAG TPA: HEAT repeat domain-containing protein [Pyrinomonadaceae bacterium]